MAVAKRKKKTTSQKKKSPTRGDKVLKDWKSEKKKMVRVYLWMPVKTLLGIDTLGSQRYTGRGGRRTAVLVDAVDLLEKVRHG